MIPNLSHPLRISEWHTRANAKANFEQSGKQIVIQIVDAQSPLRGLWPDLGKIMEDLPQSQCFRRQRILFCFCDSDGQQLPDLCSTIIDMHSVQVL